VVGVNQKPYGKSTS